MMDIRCDIILPICDQLEFTRNCIDSIIAGTDIPYRIIVINNGNSDDVRSYLSGIHDKIGERILVVQNDHNVGWVKAVNQGFALSTAPFICFQNDDTVVTKGWLTKMMAVFGKDKRIGLVNPAWEGRPEKMAIADYGAEIERKYIGKYIETDWARGFSVVLKREVLEAIGGMDEIYGLAYFDDVDFSVRAINAGFIVVVALDTYVYHHRNVTAFQVFKGDRWRELHDKNQAICYNRWGKPLRLVIILDKEGCRESAVFEKIKDTVYYLARKQHHIDLWMPCRRTDSIAHTNVDVKCHDPLWIYPSALADLYLNRLKKESKRYNAVFILSDKVYNFVTRSGWLDGIPVYGPPSGKDFSLMVRDRSDKIKEESKEFYRAKL